VANLFKLRAALQLVAAVAVSSGLSAEVANAQSTTECQKTYGGFVCNQRRENVWDSLNKLGNTIQGIREEREAKKRQSEMDARIIADEARKDEIIRLQQQNTEIEQARIDALVRSQSLLESQQEADRQAERDLRSQVSAAVLEGRCDDAKTIALLASRIDMAEQAMRLCKPKPVRPSLKSTGTAASRSNGSKLTATASVAARQAPPSYGNSRLSNPLTGDTPPAVAPASASQQPVSREYVRPSAKQIEESKKLYVRRRVVELISQGQCESAVQMASTIGEPELVKPSSASGSAIIKLPSVSSVRSVRDNPPAVAPASASQQPASAAFTATMALAEQGSATAQYNLGLMYDNGMGVAQDYAAAASWYLKAAEQGNAAAQHNLGLMYAQGQGVAQNFTAAVSWYRKAAEQGNGSAQSTLGVMYENGLGVPQDYAAAVNWYRKAADQGYSRAQNDLGEMYRKGQGISQDYVQAYMWHSIAAAGDVPEAFSAKQRNFVATKMQPAQIAEAQRLASAWRKK
jgi:TPR repeat protein